MHTQDRETCGRIALAALFLCALPALADSPKAYQLTTIAGSDRMGDSGTAVAAQIAQPEGLVVDPAGNLYIADAANHRVRKVTPEGIISTVAGNGHAGFSGDNGPAAGAQLNQPYDLALDAAGNLYIADYGNQRVRAIDANGNITTVAGNGATGVTTDGGPATGALLLGPRNLTTDPAGNLYISEFDGHRVRRVSPDGTISTAAGIGIAGLSGDGGPATAAQLAFPAGLAFDAAGNLYIVDSFNARIREVFASSRTIATVCGQQIFGLPYIQLSGLAVTPAGNLIIPEKLNSFIFQLTATGVLTRLAGAPGSGAYTGDGQAALETALATPVAVALDPAGGIYISESRRVRYIAAVSEVITTVAGSGVFGFSGDGGAATDAVLNTPTGLTINNGFLYIADQNNNRVRQIASDGSIATVAGTGTPGYSGDGLAAVAANLFGPTGLGTDSSGNLYIADTQNSRVRRVDPAGLVTTFAGNGIAAGFGGEGEAASLMPLNAPQGVAADTAGNVYISDTSHNRVMRVDPTGNIHTVAGTGTPGDTGSGQLNGPTGLALDAAGNLYIADTQNHSVRMLTPGGALSTIAGMGMSGFSGDGGPATAAQLSFPSALAIDADGSLFIADAGNNRVRLITTDGNIATIAGNGDAAYNGDNGPAVQIALFNPAGLALDGQGGVLVADTGNNRIRRLRATGTVVTPPVQISVRLDNSASMLPGPLAPGEIFTIFGEGIGPEIAQTGVFDASGQLSTGVGGVQVLFNDTAAPLFYVQAQQINAQVPYEVAGQEVARLRLIWQGLTLVDTQVSVTAASPALFTLSYGTGNAVVVNQDGSINSSQNPAARGSVVVMYATGEGQTSPARITGQAAPPPYPTPLLPVSLTMGGVPAIVQFAGEAPGYAGLMQINAQIPSGFIPTGNLPLVLWVGTNQSQPGVTVAVK